MRALVLMTVVAVGLTAPPPTIAAAATGSPPSTATIRLGVGMAGVRLGQTTGAVQANGTLGGSPFRNWGPLVGESCFEGSVCSWLVPGGGKDDLVTVERTGVAPFRVISISTSAKGWGTSRLVGAGTTAAALRRRYRSLVRMTTCDIGGFGAQRTGYRLGKHTFFETAGGKVTHVHLARNSIRAGGC